MVIPRASAALSEGRLASRSSGRWARGWVVSTSRSVCRAISSSRARMASIPSRRSPCAGRCSARSATMLVTAARDAANWACRAASWASCRASTSARPISGSTARSCPGRSADTRSSISAPSSSRQSWTCDSLSPLRAASSAIPSNGWSSIARYTVPASTDTPSASSIPSPSAPGAAVPVSGWRANPFRAPTSPSRKLNGPSGLVGAYAREICSIFWRPQAPPGSGLAAVLSGSGQRVRCPEPDCLVGDSRHAFPRVRRHGKLYLAARKTDRAAAGRSVYRGTWSRTTASPPHRHRKRSTPCFAPASPRPPRSPPSP